MTELAPKKSIIDMDLDMIQVRCTECGAPEVVTELEFLESPFCYNCGESETLTIDEDEPSW